MVRVSAWLLCCSLHSERSRAQTPPALPSAPGPGPNSTTRNGESDEVEPQAPEGEQEVLAVGSRPHPGRVPREPGVAGSVITAHRLHQPGMTVAEAVRTAPGVQVTQSGGMGSPATARLRGATSAQTPVYLGDVRINDEVGGVADLSTVPSFFVERVEVFRGHGPRRLTEVGLGGALVLVPKPLEESESAVQVEGGSFGARAVRARFGLVDGPRQLKTAVEAEGADNNYPFADSRGTLFDDQDDGQRRLSNADSTSAALWLEAGDRLGVAEVRLLAHYAQREQGAPRLALVPTESARASFDRLLLALTTSAPLGRTELTLSTRALVAETTLDDPERELGTASSHTATPGERIEQVGELTHLVGRRVRVSERLVVSVERLRRYERRGSTDLLALAAKRFLLSPSLLADAEPVRDLHLAGLVSLNCVSTSEGVADLCGQASLTGRAGGRYERDPFELYASLARYQRLATLSELYGTSILVRGNPELEPEVGWSPELGARAKWGKREQEPLVWLDLSGFARWSDQLITYVRTPQGYLRPINRDTSRTLGAEFALGVVPLRGLRLEGNLSLTDARNTSQDRTTQNDVLPFISPLTASALVNYRLTWTSHGVSETDIGFSLIHQSSRYADPAGLGVIPAQTWGDVTWGIVAVDRRIALKARVSNVWDAQRYDIVGFPLPPRSFFANMEVRW